MYRAKILAHSSTHFSPALMTVEVEYPRIVLAETVTHRVCRDTFGDYELMFSDRTTTEDISKNSASSRAIPITKMIDRVMTDPYVPEQFSKNGKGMQAAGYWVPGDPEYDEARRLWLTSRDTAVGVAMTMQQVGGVGVHKQEVNRLLEPWMWVTQILTADDIGWNNFFALRCDKHAHPAFQKIARMIYLAYRKSWHEVLNYGQWHLPFVPYEDRKDFEWMPKASGDALAAGIELPDLIQFSAARCAWVSYENHDRDGTPEQMKNTYSRLMSADPKHASPVEHQATPAPAGENTFDWAKSLRSNLRGWIQARKLVRGERTEKYTPSDDEIASWGLGE